MCCEKIFLKKLHDRGFRITPQREMVLATLHHIDGHATVDQIYARVRARSSSVDVSTVYRTLELLQEFRFVASVDLGDGQRRYELLTIRGPHHHLHCRSCGKLVRVECAEVQPLVNQLARAHGFEAELDHLIIPGLCRECRAARNRVSASERKAARSFPQCCSPFLSSEASAKSRVAPVAS